MASLEQGKRGGSNGYANAVLTVTAVALVAVALQLSGGAAAHAQAVRRSNETGDPLGVPNAFAQRQQLIQIMQSVDQRLRSLETRMGGSAPLDVRVVNAAEMVSGTVEVREQE